MNALQSLSCAAALLSAAGLLASPAIAQNGPAPALTLRQASPAPAPAPCPPLLDHRFPRLQDGAPQDLCQFAGRVVLVVNTASYCGFTHQYEGLEALYARFRERGLVVLGFPSNDFGAQEPGSAGQIADLCFNTYGVRFPMFDKSVVSGPQANALYAQLRQATGVAPKWNFHKYLIGRDCRVAATFASALAPTSSPVVAAVEAALRRQP